ncbi:hypothetical protein C6571_08695 [Simplicispira suum]|uniref:Uncharacterized protein n=1 Tax=Simplicispira suum TaxID=2109915 RepID=A0A2S0MZN0_9BURK|nr:hypothetical protein C6571_08695 [Simplicispira suum]
MGSGQTCDAGADDCDLHAGLRARGQATGKKKVAKRPDAKKRGREEKRLGISIDPPGAERLRNTKNFRHCACRMAVSSRADQRKFQEFRRCWQQNVRKFTADSLVNDALVFFPPHTGGVQKYGTATRDRTQALHLQCRLR